MSYIDPHRSGTTFGVLEFNEIFAPNASRDWDAIVSDLDTVICKIPFDDPDGDPLNAYHLLTAYRDATGTHHWYGPGIYQCINVNGSNIEMGDTIEIATTAATSPTNSRPVVQPSTGSTTTPSVRPFGICLETIAPQGVGSIAMAGVWPAKRTNTLAFRDHLYMISGGIYGTSGEDTGAMGRTMSINYPIITNAGGATVNGGVILMWGTSNEIY